MCWAFGIVEGDLDGVYWTYARREIMQKIELKLGEQSAVLLSHHNSFVIVANAALGGKADDSRPAGSAPARDMTKGAQTLDEALANINSAMMA